MARFGRSYPISSARPLRNHSENPNHPADDAISASDDAVVVAVVDASEAVSVLDSQGIRAFGSDSGSTADSSSLGWQASDSFTVTDSALLAHIGFDSATLTDAIVDLVATAINADASAATDVSRILLSQNDDAVSGADSATVIVGSAVIASDTGTAADVGISSVAIPATTEGVSGSDTAQVVISEADNASALDLSVLLNNGRVVANRVHLVPASDRTYPIPAEVRTTKVLRKSNTYIVPKD